MQYEYKEWKPLETYLNEVSPNHDYSEFDLAGLYYNKTKDNHAIGGKSGMFYSILVEKKLDVDILELVDSVIKEKESWWG